MYIHEYTDICILYKNILEYTSIYKNHHSYPGCEDSRCWGPAADFIVTVKFHSGQHRQVPPAGPLAGGPGRPRGQSHSCIQVRVRPAKRTPVHHPRAARPSRRPSDSESLSGPPVCPPVRLVRSCCPSGKLAFRSGPVKKKHKGLVLLQIHHYTHRLEHHHTHKIWNITHLIKA